MASEATPPVDSHDDLNYRFRAERSANLIKFKGVISDVSDFEPLADIFTDGAMCDLTELEFASWNGLSHLLSFLKHHSMNLILTKVPSRTFQVIRLLDPEGKHLKIEQAEMRTWDSAKKSDNFAFFELNRLRQVIDAKQEFGAIDGISLLSPLRFAIPDYPRNVSVISFPNWNPDHHEELNFWLSYAEFLVETIAVSIGLLHAGLANCLWTLSEMSATVRAVERALSILAPQKAPGLSSSIDKAKAVIKKEFAEGIAAVEMIEAQVRAEYVKLRTSITQTDADFSQTHESVNQFLKVVEDMDLPGQSLENHGSIVVENLIQLSLRPELVKQLVELQNLSEDQLKRVRDAFSIMDIMSEGDPEATAELIREELGRIDVYIQNSVVNLQVFDLTRQIIDHRVNEAHKATIHLALIPLRVSHFSALRLELEELILRKLVTDQEKRAQEYFLPWTKPTQQEGNQDPGDVLLF